jgi:HAMP domain-containing protein
MVITEFAAGDPEATMHAMATEILNAVCPPAPLQ